MSKYPSFDQYSPYIKELSPNRQLKRSDLIKPQFRIRQWGNLAQYYAPFDFANTDALVAIIGITPGWNQMEIAYRGARDGLRAGLPTSELLKNAKYAASFEGSMRTNLVRMLDELGVAHRLGMSSCSELFSSKSDQLHPTSAVRYPVFKGDRNYGGTSPRLIADRFLRESVEEMLGVELQMANRALVVPLGKAAEEAIEHLVALGQLDKERCLTGFPHPSGANGHRNAQFAQNRSAMEKKVRVWFST